MSEQATIRAALLLGWVCGLSSGLGVWALAADNLDAASWLALAIAFATVYGVLLVVWKERRARSQPESS